MIRKTYINNLEAQYHEIDKDIQKSIKKVLHSGQYILGPQVKAFEHEFAKFISSSYCVGVASGTDAITLSLLALGATPGDEVITSGMTAFPTIVGIQRAGAIPVLVDINPHDGLINPNLIEKKITKRTKFIIPVHLFGQSADMDLIKTISKKYNLKIIEDCAQSTGATYKNQKTGSIGHCGAFSFYPTKNLGAYGDAGAVTTRSKAVYQKILKLRNYGFDQNTFSHSPSLNSRLDEIQASILRVKLRKLNASNSKRQKLARIYYKLLKTVSPMAENNYGKSVFHLFVIKSMHRNQLIKNLKKKNIIPAIHYPYFIPNQSGFNGKKNTKLPYVKELSKQILTLPLDPTMTKESIMKICRCVNDLSSKQNHLTRLK